MTGPDDARFWDKVSKRYARLKISDTKGYQKTLDRTRAFLNPTNRILELGCGTGSTALQLADAVETYLATDISPEMIRIAEERAAQAPIPGLRFVVATADTISPDEGPFDAVLGFNYIHLTQDVPATLAKIRSLLPADGLFISKTPCLGDMTPVIRYAVLPVLQILGLAPRLTSLRSFDLEDMIKSAGFEIIASEIHATSGKKGRPFIVARKKS